MIEVVYGLAALYLFSVFVVIYRRCLHWGCWYAEAVKRTEEIEKQTGTKVNDLFLRAVLGFWLIVSSFYWPLIWIRVLVKG